MYNFQIETLVMQTSAKNTGESEVLIIILEVLSQVKTDCHEILSGALGLWRSVKWSEDFVSSGLEVVEIEAR